MIYVAGDMTVEVDDSNRETFPALFEPECGCASPSN